jgi:hypothetical protein
VVTIYLAVADRSSIDPARLPAVTLDDHGSTRCMGEATSEHMNRGNRDGSWTVQISGPSLQPCWMRCPIVHQCLLPSLLIRYGLSLVIGLVYSNTSYIHTHRLDPLSFSLLCFIVRSPGRSSSILRRILPDLTRIGLPVWFRPVPDHQYPCYRLLSLGQYLHDRRWPGCYVMLSYMCVYTQHNLFYTGRREY